MPIARKERAPNRANRRKRRGWRGSLQKKNFGRAAQVDLSLAKVQSAWLGRPELMNA